jgi:hypothetical protein
MTEAEYRLAMLEAIAEFRDWEKNKKKNAKKTKEKYRAQRLAKLHMTEMLRGEGL